MPTLYIASPVATAGFLLVTAGLLVIAERAGRIVVGESDGLREGVRAVLQALKGPLQDVPVPEATKAERVIQTVEKVERKLDNVDVLARKLDELADRLRRLEERRA